MADLATAGVTGFTALVLAGSRGGRDPVAGHAGVAHKALIEIEGRTLLQRVASALIGAGAARVVVSVSDDTVAMHARAIGLDTLPAEAGPSASVGAAFATIGPPLLVTTADHALLEAEWVRDFRAGVPADADIAVLLAERRVVEAAAPGTRRTYLRFADGQWSGCNLFALQTPAAAAALRLWSMVEADRKRPWRIVARLGPALLGAYLANRLTLDRALARLGERAGVRAAAVASEYGLAAVDVDRPDDLTLVREILARRTRVVAKEGLEPPTPGL